MPANLDAAANVACAMLTAAHGDRLVTAAAMLKLAKVVAGEGREARAVLLHFLRKELNELTDEQEASIQ
jgi:hypothetical protein